MSDDLYKILGIRHDADDKEVRSAYRRLARRYHPDTGKGSSGEKFRAVQHAYDVLGDAEQRAAYDREREARPQRAVHPDPPQWHPFSGVHSPPGSHIDLRHLGRHPAAERIEFGGPDSARREADLWDELIAYLFRRF